MPEGPRPLSPLLHRVGGALLLIVGVCALLAAPAEAVRRSFTIAGGDAATTLRQLSDASGGEILFATEVVRGVRTNAVRGDYTPLEAARQMLAGTALMVTQDDKTGALAVYRQPGQAGKARPKG